MEAEKRSYEKGRPFWNHVDDSKPDDCWPWMGYVHKTGYGNFNPARGKVVGAHREAYRRAYGAIPEGMMVLHRCDNPRCCNPAHLWVGTQSDNMRDMWAKKRHPGRCSKERLGQEGPEGRQDSVSDVGS